MTDFASVDSDSRSEKTALELLHELLFGLLLVTDGRTTELLETLLNEKLVVTVLRQERWDKETYIRESVLTGEKSGFIVSHNVALVSSKHLPAPLFEKIADRQEGIGKTIGSNALRSFRKVVEAGRIDAADAVDLFRRPLRLQLPELRSQVPYKKYLIYFDREPGIQMLEYYHPDLVRHRLRRETGR
ncbi:4-hydroxybenzoate synthetase [Paenibacillus antri]|uniref:4-hydroxybenzoate synthetase n=1 Tax=Paenibacillus antri TaxID=2582848 RepID=A0A5R9G4G0_9BACL|nr:4-hydroxybenzoate synthetase [Paenibacillus antri]TLS50661.1 4-hydroxybenzoate synthetase [Paenibacillus antri]